MSLAIQYAKDIVASDNAHGGFYTQAAVTVAKALLAMKEQQSAIGAQNERVAQLIAHRACHNQEQDVQNGKLAGYCIVCGVPWPCEIAAPAASPQPELADALNVASTWRDKGTTPLRGKPLDEDGAIAFDAPAASEQQEPVLWTIRIQGGSASSMPAHQYAEYHHNRVYLSQETAEGSSWMEPSFDGDRSPENRRKASVVALYAAPQSAPTEVTPTAGELIQRFEQFWSMVEPLFGDADSKKAIRIKHSMWTTWQVAHAASPPMNRDEP